MTWTRSVHGLFTNLVDAGVPDGLTELGVFLLRTLLVRHSADLDGSSYVGTRVYGGKVEVSLLEWRPAAPCLGPHPRAVTVAQDAQSY